jgi:Ca2+-binding RTX toxin-like protein
MEGTMVIDKTLISNTTASWSKLLPSYQDITLTSGPDIWEAPASLYLFQGARPINYRIYAGEGNDTVHAGAGTDEVYGGSGTDFLYGMDGNDTLYGEQGDDYLIGGTGADLMFGGMGDDHYWVDNTQDKVTEALNDGIDTVYSTVDFTLPPDVEILALDGFAILGIGNAQDNRISGTNGSNYLEGGGGKDEIRSFNGTDTLAGGADADTFVFFNGLDDGAKTIVDFKASGADHDFIELHDYAGVGIHDFASLQHHMYDDGIGAVIDLGNGNQIMLQNVFSFQLTAADFHIF